MPNASQLTPVRAGHSLVALLEADRLLELRAVELYREAARYCALIDDAENLALFQGLHDEELDHAREIEAWLERLRRASMALETSRALPGPPPGVARAVHP